MRHWLVGLWVLLCVTSGAQATEALQLGARTYHERCTICHGASGYGDGLLPMYMGNYPNTALVRARKAGSMDEIRQVVEMGGTRGGSPHSPPWRDELSAEEIEAVVEVVALLRADRDAAFALLDETRPASVPDPLEGRVLFKTYCARCHGEQGYGDGRMAKVYTNPPPFPLVYSVMPAAYLTTIISKGGGAVSRSEIMPAFAEQLTETQIQSVIMHLYSMRQLRTRQY